MNTTKTNDPETCYFQAVDHDWRALTGHALSPLDWAYIEAWYESRLPLACLRTGIRGAVTAFRKANGEARIHSIAYCAQAIMDKWAEAAPNLAATYDPERRNP